MSNRLFSPLKRKPEWDTENFSVMLLEKEIELEKGSKIEVIEDLITLYSTAIEHYNEINDSKFYDYQDRLHKLLVRSEVSSVLNGEKVNNLYQVTKRKNFLNHQNIKNKLYESMKGNFKPKNEPETVSMKKQDIVSNVSDQEMQLNDRVNHRRSVRISTFQDIADISTKNSYYLDEKEQIEEIMEKYFSEKAKEIEEITLRYMLLMDSCVDISDKHKYAQEMSEQVIKISKKYEVDRLEALQRLKDSLKTLNTPKHY